MKALISSLVLSSAVAISAQASDRNCTCRGESLNGKAITIVFNGYDGVNNLSEAHVQIKVDGTSMKYHKALKVYLEPATVGRVYAVSGPDFKLALNIPAQLNVGDFFSADYTYGLRSGQEVKTILKCKSTQIQ